MLSKCFLILYCIFFLSACGSINYFSHLAKGQFDLLWARENVSDMLSSEQLSKDLESRLLLSQEIRKFAESQLYLPVAGAYSSYSDLKRPYVVWNVYAAPQLSFDSYTWCYPFLGCLAYRGFYDKQDAEASAQLLKNEGYEVKVGGVRAYSTLGFFDDPLLNTFISQHEVAFVELLIHEISHRLLYIDNDTKFNENFATAVALLGAEEWYQAQNNQALYRTYQAHKTEQKKLVNFMLQFKQALESVYGDDTKTDEEKYLLKNKHFKQLPLEFKAFKLKHKLDDRYDQWVLSMNNASLSTLANYQALVPGFVALFHQQDSNWQRFYAEVARIAKYNKAQRHAFLNQLAKTFNK